MRTIITAEENGEFATVGTRNRFVVQGSIGQALQRARIAAQFKRANVLVQSWYDREFYKPDTKPVFSEIVKPQLPRR